MAIRQGTAPARLISIHDPEMRHGRKSAAKRFDGHKAALAVDTDTQLITAVDVLAGNASDAEDALALVEQTEQATECTVDETYGDCAYGSGETRQAFADAGRTLRAKVPAMTNGDCFPKTAFTIDLDARTCTCPEAQTTDDLRGSAGGPQHFVFATATCGACPLRAQCVKGTGGRTIALHPQEALLQEARAFQASDAFAEVRCLRQAVEHRIARVVQLGLRQARYVGKAKTLFQLALAATVANLTLLAAAEVAAASDATPTVSAAALTALLALGSLLIALVFARSAGWTAPTLRPSRTRCTRWWDHGAPTPVLATVPSREMASSRPHF